MILILISIALAAWLVSQLKVPECLKLTLAVAIWMLISGIFQTAIWAFTDTAEFDFADAVSGIVIWTSLIIWVLLRASRLSVLALLICQGDGEFRQQYARAREIIQAYFCYWV